MVEETADMTRKRCYRHKNAALDTLRASLDKVDLES